jgi:hypothetical protein
MKESLKLKFSKISPPHGLDNNWGQTIEKHYVCLCGKGKITTEEETMTGFKTFFTTICCDECKKNYRLVNPNSRNWNIEKAE